jgi:hypothetical protein
MDGNVYHAGSFVPIEDPFPALSAICGLVDPTLRVGSGVNAERSHPDRVAVAWVNADARDVLCLRETEMGPGAPGVRALIDPIALLDIPADLCLPGPDIDDIGIRFADRYRADRGAGDLPVRHGPPRGPTVLRLPQPTSGCAEIVFHGSGVAPGDADRSASSIRAHILPPHPVEEILRGEDLCTRSCRGKEKQEEPPAEDLSRGPEACGDGVEHVRFPLSE